MSTVFKKALLTRKKIHSLCIVIEISLNDNRFNKFI